MIGKLPKELQGRHFGPNLVAYVLYQHHHCHVTQPLLHEQLREWGVDISAGQINAILLDGKTPFHDEKDALLAAGLTLSTYVTVDDSGARHQGKNGYVTHIGNQYFASFHSSMSKSRVNFLELLRAGQTDYRITASALDYMKAQGLSQVFLDALRSDMVPDFANKAAWEAHMESLGMHTPRYRRIATEGALLGSLSELHIAKNMAIISDDAGQFNILTHGLCWVHAERLIHKMLAAQRTTSHRHRASPQPSLGPVRRPQIVQTGASGRTQRGAEKTLRHDLHPEDQLYLAQLAPAAPPQEQIRIAAGAGPAGDIPAHKRQRRRY